MKHDDAALKLAELGHTTRLAIYRLLVQAGDEGLPVSRLQEQLSIPGSTLSHHLSRLVKAGLMQQIREGRVLRCQACYDQLTGLINYLTEECCSASSQVKDCQKTSCC